VADLVGKNYSGLSDPFVEVEVLGVKKKTRFQKELTSCVFDDTFYFNFEGEFSVFCCYCIHLFILLFIFICRISFSCTFFCLIIYVFSFYIYFYIFFSINISISN
jgi:C2 domain